MSILIATATDAELTPELFYAAMALIQLLVVLVAFRIMDMDAQLNTFSTGLCVVGATNIIAYFTSGFGMIGVLITATVLFLFLLAGSRGEVGKSCAAWLVVILTYWGGAYYVVEVEHSLESEDLGGIPQLFLDGQMEGQGLTSQDYQRLRDG